MANILSIFIDESGDFGAYQKHAPYYLVSLVLHEQRIDIYKDIACFEGHVVSLGYKKHAVHTGPLIRRETLYTSETRTNRQKLFNALFNFMRSINIHYGIVKVDKCDCVDKVAMTAKLSYALAKFLRDNNEYLITFDKIVVYYDNGQIELTRVLTAVFTALLPNVEFHNCTPVKYELAQVADLICTLELIAEKTLAGNCSKSEVNFFGSLRELKRNYLKNLRKKLL